MKSKLPIIISAFIAYILILTSCNNTTGNPKEKSFPSGTKNISATYNNLIEMAQDVRMSAYAPYSKFLVGSAVLGESGKIYTGCNVENASYGLAICAERNAIFHAVASGEKKIKAIAVVLDAPDFGSPCGACRQVIYEFGSEADVIMATVNGNQKIEKIKSLIPYAFGPSNLEK